MSSLISTTLLLVSLDEAGIDVRFSSLRGGWLAFHKDGGRLFTKPMKTAVAAGRAGLEALEKKAAA